MPKAPDPFANLSAGQRRALATPSGFSEAYLELPLYPWQRDVVAAVAPLGSRVALRACNESGKTSRIAVALILWHLAVFPHGRVVSTAGAWRQVKDQLVPSLRRHQAKFPNWRFDASSIVIDRSPRYIGFSTNDAGKFEGFHGSPDEPLLIIVDEAKTVPDEVFEAVERCKPQRLLIMSSPGFAEGEFHQAFGRKRRHFTPFKAAWQDCPHWTEADQKRIREKWGEDHALVRSMLDAEFMDGVEDAVIPMNAIEACVHIDAAMPSGKPDAKNTAPRRDRKAFCDFAAGGDENVLAIREGKVVRIAAAWRDRDTMSACGRFAALFREHGLRPEEIEGDADGLGKVMLDALAEAGWEITPFRGGSAPLTDSHYKNRISEVWHEGAKRIARGDVILPPDDELISQLSSRRKKWDSKGKLWIEPKEELRRRNLPSPDRADAVLAVLAPRRDASPWNLIRDEAPKPTLAPKENLEPPAREDDASDLMGGIDAGV